MRTPRRRVLAPLAGWMSLSLAGLLRLTSPAASATQPLAEPARQPAEPASEGARLFLEAWRIAKIAFYDPRMHGVDWDAVRDGLLPKAAEAPDSAAVSAVINEALARLHASHTGHFTRDRREYYEVLDVFFPSGVPARDDSSITPGPVQYVGVGLVAIEIDGKSFAADVYDAGPAARAGLRVGDELVGIRLDDDQVIPWADVAPFRGRDGKTTTLIIRRGRAEATEDLPVTPAWIRPRELYLESMKVGARVIEKDGHRIAYARVRSYAHPDYHKQLKDLIAEEFAGADALVVDIRAGWGGANPSYMDIFNPVAPTLTQRTRDGVKRVSRGAWGRPAAVLIDGGSRSGKEMLAFAIKKHRVATLVGECTAGAVLGGTVRPLSDGSVLFIAVSDVDVDGVRLEGIGVEPDVRVERNLPYCNGRDEQLEAALDLLVKQLEDQK